MITFKAFPYFIIFLLYSYSLIGQTSKTYYDYRKNEVYLPLGDKSFADKLISFKNGNPASIGISANSNNCIGPPDFKKDGDEFAHTSLGCGGEIILKFTDNILIDVNGPDLYIFEVGISIESTSVYISTDATKWIYVGIVKGGLGTIDIQPYIRPNSQFQYIKLIDLKSRCGPEKTKGADIDAVAAIGSLPIPSKPIKQPNIYNTKTTTSKSNTTEKINIEKRTIEFKDEMQINSDSISITIWDNEKEDGDSISLYLNNKLILENYRITKQPQTFIYKLKLAENELVMKAENLGTSPPNTAAFIIKSSGLTKTIHLESDLQKSQAIKIFRKE